MYDIISQINIYKRRYECMYHQIILYIANLVQQLKTFLVQCLDARRVFKTSFIVFLRTRIDTWRTIWIGSGMVKFEEISTVLCISHNRNHLSIWHAWRDCSLVRKQQLCPNSIASPPSTMLCARFSESPIFF